MFYDQLLVKKPDSQLFCTYLRIVCVLYGKRKSVKDNSIKFGYPF